ncbi:MAG: hypothetical protein KF724_07685 [Phycisphaeraceae bacterium]|nr:hypothetical protein [Phycisphaeraceae bacterium]
MNDLGVSARARLGTSSRDRRFNLGARLALLGATLLLPIAMGSAPIADSRDSPAAGSPRGGTPDGAPASKSAPPGSGQSAPTGQAPPPGPAPDGAPASSGDDGDEPEDEVLSRLSRTVVELEALGVKMRVPKFAIVEPMPGSNSYRIDDGQDPPRYLVRVQTMVASAATSSPEQQLRQHLEFLVEKGQEYTIIRDVDLTIDRANAKLTYLSMPAGEGITAVTGYLMIQTGPNTFIVFSIITSGFDFAEADGLLAAAFSTISLAPLEVVAQVQAEKLDRTQRFLKTLTPERLRAVADERPRWFRLYRPGAGRDGGDLEAGFLRIRVFEEERGEVSSSSIAGSRTEPEMGLMVEVIAKMLLSGDATHTLDMQSRFWQSWDREAENWSIVSTERRGGQSSTGGQTGWRARRMSTGEQGSILTVVNSQSSQATRDDLFRSRQSQEWEIPEVGYINQAEVILLGILLPRDGSFDGDYSFYWYDSRSNRLPQRIDRWTADPDGSGRYTLISRPSADSPEMKQLFGRDGERLRRIDADGLVTEAIEHADLMRIWRSKGLPTG